MRIGFYTLGCKVNQYETEAMKEKFMAAGHEVVGSIGEEQGADVDSDGDASDTAKEAIKGSESEDSLLMPADAYIINTCTVTNMADRKSRQFIRRAKKLNPDSVIAVVGCYAQVDPDAVSKIEGVDIILGTNEKSNILEAVEKRIADKLARLNPENNFDADDSIYQDSSAPFIDVISRSELYEYKSDGIITAMESRTRAYIKIQEGCDRFCSYCIIPIARGPVRSRSEEEIIEEAKGLVGSGFKEIVLTGINTALYGQETSASDGARVPPIRRVLDKLSEIPGDFRIRLSSLEPNVMKAEDVLSIVGAEKLCNHLHLSIQSGSDSILKAMNRHYTREEYLGIVKALKNFDPYFAITTDIIVGFPGETDEDFQDSMDLVKTAGLSRVHVFPYSPRKGTVAADMDNQVSTEEKKRRAKQLSDVADDVAREFHESCRNVTTRALFEENKGDIMTGYTDNYIRVYVDAKEEYINKLVDVELQELYGDGMKAKVIYKD
ncbi:MAG: tRNA (N(6)-L-threonylcarbamoyladenosine(37)-C(2))-methylthiotransferase MtaB [Firmicutes bacterium]|nr:tRNA (N(6)-L-threonylcarbamoyladenosine(37)-C(2))-methylthiotransferase MtaB [Bacillota bacterium]